MRSLLSGVSFAILLVTACSQSEPKPPFAFEGTVAGGSPCERSGWMCAPSGKCLSGTVSAGHSLGCDGENATCCMPAGDAGPDASHDADAAATNVDASADAADASDATAASDAADGGD